MAGRRKASNLERWEVAIVKGLLKTKKYNDQEILAYFTRPNRTINHRAIGEIRAEKKHASIRAASDEDVEDFLASWPNITDQAGLRIPDDELLIKAREAMIAAVHTFNGAGLYFRAEIFIVTVIIAWTYISHAWFKRAGINYIYANARTPQGGDMYWDLSKCLRHNEIPIPTAAKTNLEFLIAIRHEIEHRMTSRIDDTLGSHFQACCMNFNEFLKSEFGTHHSLEKRLPIALQFVSFGAAQRRNLKRLSEPPENLTASIAAFEENLTDAQKADPAYRMRTAFVQLLGNSSAGSDQTVQFIKADTEEGKAINQIFFKEIQKNRHTATAVVDKIHEAGFPRFTTHNHTQLWQRLDGKNPGKGYGCRGDYKGTWVWFDNWIQRVLEHCEANRERYS
ncbi:MAG: DUF3644 domain-containing protein [Alphaproteobacteria bacterium]|nr:DUF3644 domain-containing protein [Alphaproteobacteria bacterium]